MTKLPFFPTLGQTLKNTFKDLYSSLGFTMLMSLIFFVAYLPIFMAILGALSVKKTPDLTSGDIFIFQLGLFLLAVIWNSFILGPIVTALYSLFQERKTDYPSIPMFFRLFKKNYLRSMVITLISSIVIAVLCLNISIMRMTGNLLLIVSGVISIYVLIVIWFMQFYIHPLIFVGNSVKKVIRKSFLLTMDNLALTFAFSLILGVLFIIMNILIIFLVLIYGGLYIFFLDKGFEVIYNKYD